MPDLVEKIVAVHEALKTADLPHAFGGALALAWCTERARGTIDIDVNIFVPVASHQSIIEAMPEDVRVRKQDLKVLKRDGQVRIWWDKTPLDLFLNTTEFHNEVAKRIRWEMFGGTAVPFLSCSDLAVFKVFFNRTRDWADIEAMHAADNLDVSQVRATIARHMGDDDERIARLDALQRG
ncbi:MAG: hypothetical protein O7F71_22980 [Gammaproteobacteria bacterium]|nr:hypothetical protein [Gammaproteobacteria bacterium]